MKLRQAKKVLNKVSLRKGYYKENTTDNAWLRWIKYKGGKKLGSGNCWAYGLFLHQAIEAKLCNNQPMN